MELFGPFGLSRLGKGITSINIIEDSREGHDENSLLQKYIDEAGVALDFTSESMSGIQNIKYYRHSGIGAAGEKLRGQNSEPHPGGVFRCGGRCAAGVHWCEAVDVPV